MTASRINRVDRITTVQQVHDRKGQLPTGVEGQNIPSDFFIPSVGLEDVDKAVFDLFEERLKLQVSTTRQGRIIGESPVPTIFAGGERFALVKGKSPPRDRSNAFILPLVSIYRTGLEQSELGAISGRGLGVDTGELVIRRKLSERDPRYQNLVNKMRLRNQDNVASQENRIRQTAPQGSIPGKIATRRQQPRSYNSLTGEMLAPDLSKNIFEIITIPFPHFYTALYEVTFWTQYQQHMNQLIERFMTSYDAQGNQFRLLTDKGYWFVAYIGDDWSSDDNFSDYTGEERFVRYKFTLRVPAYLNALERKGVGVPFRKFLSAPQISFELNEGTIPANIPKGAPVGSGDINKFILSDVDRLDRRGDRVESEREFPLKIRDTVHDPFSGKDIVKLRRVLSSNSRKGETVLSKRLIRRIDDINF